MKQFSLSTPVKALYMVGKTYAKRLEKLEIKTVEDLLNHYPHRYKDFRIISKIANLQAEEKVTIQGEIVSFENIYTRWGKKIQKAILADETGQIQVTWFNQPFLRNTLKVGTKVSLSGKVKLSGFKLEMSSPEYEIIKEQGLTIHTGRLVPVYPETYGVSSKWLRSRIAPALFKLTPRIKDFLPQSIKKSFNFIDLSQALLKIHFPNEGEEIKRARARLSFDELFLIQLQTLLRKNAWQKRKLSHRVELDQEKILQFIADLPFTLTSAQKRATKEILADLAKNEPMNRLLEGDVGSGKTVVAAIVAYACFLNNLKVLFMAPTEILAFQHYQTIKTLLESYGVRVELLTGSKKTLDSKKVTQRSLNFQSSQKDSVSSVLRHSHSDFDILIGTHALLFNQASFENLGLVVIDEQHRFGVEQRAKLIKKSKGKTPHILTMTATPIPRTVALTLYGDLDLSILDEMPEGRKKVKTWVVPLEKRIPGYQWIKEQIKKDKIQVFVVCPLIEESIKESMKDIKAATQEFERLNTKVFPEFKLGLLHGRLKAKEKEMVIGKFRQKKLDILVCTPVVEVGIDIPNAAIMLVEAAERFGLAQLHQLRGRVGRGEIQSYCLLYSTFKRGQQIKRLKAMQTCFSGFRLAEIDLELRGPGEIYGTKQHGWPNLKIASFSDALLIEKTRSVAKQILEKGLQNYPLLKKKLKKTIIREVEPN